MRFNAHYGRLSSVNKTLFKEYYSSSVHVKYFIRPKSVCVCACHHKTIANARGNIKLRRYILRAYNNNNNFVYIIMYNFFAVKVRTVKSGILYHIFTDIL